MRLALRTLVAATLSLPLLAGGVTAASAAPARPRPSVRIQVAGDVSRPSTLSRQDLTALPQTSLVDARPHGGQHELTGVLLQTVIDDAAPVLPDAKNAALRVSAVIAGSRGRVAVARGELDPGLGDHPALLVLSRDGHPLRGAPELVFPTDTNGARTVRGVRRIDVAVAPTATTSVAEGSIVVATGRRDVVLSAERLAALPQQTRTVTFTSRSGQQTHVETGPALASVLHAARVRTTPVTVVAASATDGYVAVVTPGEVTSGGRALLLSLNEDGTGLVRPRVVADGDIAGGRYVSDVTVLTVSGTRCR